MLDVPWLDPRIQPAMVKKLIYFLKKKMLSYKQYHFQTKILTVKKSNNMVHKMLISKFPCPLRSGNVMQQVGDAL